VFELSMNEAHSISFGSSNYADIRLPGTRPYAFFLSRNETGVWLRPTTVGRNLYVNGFQRTTRTQLFDCTIVQLPHIRLVLWLRTSPPTHLKGVCRYIPYSLLSSIQSSPSAHDVNENAASSEPSHSMVNVRLDRADTTPTLPNIRLTPPADTKTQVTELDTSNFERPTEPTRRRLLIATGRKSLSSSPALALEREISVVTPLKNLGHMTQHRPLIVALSATFATLLLMFLMVAATHLLSQHSPQRKAMSALSWETFSIFRE
jgi:hypothetical protein